MFLAFSFNKIRCKTHKFLIVGLKNYIQNQKQRLSFLFWATGFNSTKLLKQFCEIQIIHWQLSLRWKHLLMNTYYSSHYLSTNKYIPAFQRTKFWLFNGTFFFYSRYYDSSDLRSSTFSKWDDNSDAFWKKENNNKDIDILLTSKSTGFSDRYTKKNKLTFVQKAQVLMWFESWS